MTRYVVLRPFRDKQQGLKRFNPGDIHEPGSEERARELIDRGFIAAVETAEEPATTPDDAEPEASREPAKVQSRRRRGEG